MSLRAGRRTAAALAAAAAGTMLIGTVPAAGAAPASPAAITLTPVCGPVAGTAQPIEITVVGTDFNPFNDVLVTFDSDVGGHPESFSASTDGFGRFTVVIRPQLRPAGTYQVRADDFRQREATAKFTVPCPSVPPVLFTPTLRFDPPIGPTGFVTKLIGAGFPHGQPVTLVWDHGIMSLPNGLVTAGDDGTFAVDILIFHHDLRGTRTMSAAPGPGATDDYVAPKADFLVVPGTMQPRTFTERR